MESSNFFLEIFYSSNSLLSKLVFLSKLCSTAHFHCIRFINYISERERERARGVIVRFPDPLVEPSELGNLTRGVKIWSDFVYSFSVEGQGRGRDRKKAETWRDQKRRSSKERDQKEKKKGDTKKKRKKGRDQKEKIKGRYQKKRDQN